MPAPRRNPPCLSREQVIRLWLHCQGLLDVSTPRKLDRKSFVEHLESTGGLQLDTVNVVERAHYLTLWSRFGSFDRTRVDQWIYGQRLAYEYWGHEASILPISHLPFGMQRMKRFPPESWREAAYWKHYATSTASKRRVLRRLREFGPLDSTAFEKTEHDHRVQKQLGWGSPISKEDKRSLELLWHAGKVAIANRKHFRKTYDLAHNVYPDVSAVGKREFEDSWLLVGLRGNGVASESHLVNYVTAPNLKAQERRRVIERNVRSRRVVAARVAGFDEVFYALPELLDLIPSLDAPAGTTLLCPFDSLLWQRKRAEQLLDYHYRIEIYLPESKRKFGYYALPILHAGRLVGRLDPKFHRDRGVLEVKSMHFEAGFRPNRPFRTALDSSVEHLAQFVGAENIELVG